jgi:hypothetical protein
MLVQKKGTTYIHITHPACQFYQTIYFAKRHLALKETSNSTKYLNKNERLQCNP